MPSARRDNSPRISLSLSLSLSFALRPPPLRPPPRASLSSPGIDRPGGGQRRRQEACHTIRAARARPPVEEPVVTLAGEAGESDDLDSA